MAGPRRRTGDAAAGDTPPASGQQNAGDAPPAGGQQNAGDAPPVGGQQDAGNTPPAPPAGGTNDEISQLREELRLLHAEIARLAPKTTRNREKIEIPELVINNVNEEHLWFEYRFKLEAAAKRLGIGLKDDDVDEEGDEHLYYLLTVGLKGRPLNIVRRVAIGRGRAALKKLREEYETENVAIVNQIYGQIEMLRVDGGDDPMLSLDKLDDHVWGLSSRGEVVDDKSKVRHLLRMISGNPIYDITREVLTTKTAKLTPSSVSHAIVERYRAHTRLHSPLVAAVVPERRGGDAPKGWQFHPNSCRKCGYYRTPSHTENTCKTPEHRRIWNRPPPSKRWVTAKANRRELKRRDREEGDTHRKKAVRFDTSGNHTPHAAARVVATCRAFAAFEHCGDFIVDTGSSVHFAGINDVIEGTLVESKLRFDGITDGAGTTIGIADVLLSTLSEDGQPVEIVLHDVYITRKGIRLLSVPRLLEDRHPDVSFDVDFRRRKLHAGDIVIPLYYGGGHYTLQTRKPPRVYAVDAGLRHRRQGHYGHLPGCKACIRGKATRIPRRGNFDRERASYERGELWQCDIKFMNELSFQGHKHVLRFVCMKTGYFHSVPVDRMDAGAMVVMFGSFLQAVSTGEFDVKRIHGDGQFDVAELRTYLASKKIELTISAARASTHCAIVERSLRTTSQSVRAMLLDAKLPMLYWEYAWFHSEWIWNRLANSRTNITPITALFDVNDFEHPHDVPVFGCPAFALVTPGRGKIREIDMTRNGKFVGRRDHAYLILPDDGNLLLKIRDVRFVENQSNAAYALRDAGAARETGTPVPQRWGDIKNDPELVREWLPAIRKEYEGLIQRDTFAIIERDGHRTISTRLLLREKRDAEGNVISKKARTIAHGFKQIAGVDYDETSSNVSRLESVRCVLACSACSKYCLVQVDVDQAYLQASMDRDVYIEIPEGYNEAMGTDLDPNRDIMRLNKSLPGLKQSGRMWSMEYQATFRELGLKPCLTDPCVFVDDHTVLTIYVDDMLICSPRRERADEIINVLQERYGCKNMGDLRTLLGMRIVVNDRGVIIDQPGYIEKVVEKHGTSGSTDTPWPSDFKRRDEPALSPEEHALYRTIVGELAWVANASRPDIAHAVSLLSRSLSEPTGLDLKVAHRVLGYLATHSRKAIHYAPSASGKIHLVCYVDSDFANDESRRSRTGFVTLINGAPVSWASKMQSMVTLSSTEAEFIAISAACCEVQYLRMLLTEIRLFELVSCLIRTDSEAALKLIRNPCAHSRTKHIDVKYRFIREHYEKGDIAFEHVRSEENIADMLTKQLPSNGHHRHLSQLFCRDDYDD